MGHESRYLCDRFIFALFCDLPLYIGQPGYRMEMDALGDIATAADGLFLSDAKVFSGGSFDGGSEQYTHGLPKEEFITMVF